MPTLAVVDFNIVCATLGGFISLFGLVSYLIKEKFHLSEALIALVAGLVFSPHAANFIRPEVYALHDAVILDTITLYFSRLVLGVQLVIAGVQLPSRYLRLEWRSLALLLGPGMCCMWICTALLTWAMVPHIDFLHALAVAACVTPTDPVLSNSIVKGKFADRYIPRELQKIVVAESGTNDGLGYPFLFLPLYLIKYLHHDGGAGKAIGMWFYETWVYTIILSVIYGAVVGWLARKLLQWAERNKYVDRESFLVFAIAIALFLVGTVGMIGSDDVLACFIAGNTIDDSLQPTIDMLLNVSIFIWFGANCPWYLFDHSSTIPIYRLIFLGILVLLFRRIPIILLMHKKIHQIEEFKQALFVGFFGPIGVSAIFYLYISLEFLRDIEVNGETRPDAAQLEELFTVVIWFLVICSIIIHGLAIPLGKLGIRIPRTISTARDQRDGAVPRPRVRRGQSSGGAAVDGADESSPSPTPSANGGIMRAPRSRADEYPEDKVHGEGANGAIPGVFFRLGRKVTRRRDTEGGGGMESGSEALEIGPAEDGGPTGSDGRGVPNGGSVGPAARSVEFRGEDRSQGAATAAERGQ
ncbi:Sodium/hydrogen exchanger family-domain-containing protein [Lineolata rhizophorae]|uniref:Sodium/hydrogen exchanger family-domain-containing protein n=1 Tax=Lineolata rhizophorae TaxID=578093 RepID=A0A6A6NRX5_9PEZI|nr:Sodium/hydrogen exchanger family-domain-containing protein [Lineolata rhizophorae]